LTIKHTIKNQVGYKTDAYYDGKHLYKLAENKHKNIGIS